MPALPPWPRDRMGLLKLAFARCQRFATLNGLPPTDIHVVAKAAWHFDACAFYRPDTDAAREFSVGEQMMRERGYGPGINICLEHCGRPCGEENSRNWSWPGSVIDRTVYGVVCHEFAHHWDWCAGSKKGTYFSDYGEGLMRATGEPPVTNYAKTNPAEWFAEAGRIWITNPPLLRALMPKLYVALSQRFKPLYDGLNWEYLIRGAPARVIKSIVNRGVRLCRTRSKSS